MTRDSVPTWGGVSYQSFFLLKTCNEENVTQVIAEEEPGTWSVCAHANNLLLSSQTWLAWQGFDMTAQTKQASKTWWIKSDNSGLATKTSNHNVLLLCFVDKLPQQVFTSTLGRSVKISSVMTNWWDGTALAVQMMDSMLRIKFDTAAGPFLQSHTTARVMLKN